MAALKRDTAVRTYLLVADITALVTLIFVTVWIWQPPEEIGFILIPIHFAGLLFLFLRGFRDEYLQSLWYAGASFAFGFTVLYGIVGTFFQGILDMMAEDGLIAVGPDFFNDFNLRYFTTLIVAFFFVGFNIRRWRGY